MFFSKNLDIFLPLELFCLLVNPLVSLFLFFSPLSHLLSPILLQWKEPPTSRQKMGQKPTRIHSLSVQPAMYQF
ncbi:hypothetical protein QBC32DRAFT_337650 [Pseudoneurospora amorphoporcata]|uniref:Uncharacterized protein n=1 Tax=Pseudoneurospora amorphoporcata TaxID=241081 RepID=A0AAN6NXX0_9PEZI|nr:hypothetical protein QBC32DRAFT_337650 [Pseudoneurospora amorphoporcata]